jgi:hypothetical protein
MVAWSTAAALKARPSMSTLSDPQALAAVEAASEILDALTMHSFGLHDDVVRPEGCGGSCDVGAPSERAVVGWGLSQPLARVIGPWPLPGPYGGLLGYCGGCHGLWTAGVQLLYPVTAVSEVLVDGAVVDAANWQVWNGNILLRTDGKVWPHCQNLLLATTETGTFQVSYTHGVPVPSLGVQAALSLAAELVRWWAWTEGECRLPKRITSLTRQGVTAIAVDPMTIIQEGGTGLPDADLFVASVMKGPRRARISTPGVDSGLQRRTV